MSDTPTRVVVVRFPRWSAFADAYGRGARSAFEPIVRAVVTHAPLVEVATPGVIVFATRGPSRYVGGDERLAALVHEAVGDALGHAMRASDLATYGVGIADGRLAGAVAALQALTSNVPVVVAAGESGRWLAEASVRTLVDCVDVIGAVGAGVPGADDVASYRDVVSLLERLGMYRFGDVAALHEADLIARFGAFGRDLCRLSRGLDRHPPLVVEPPPDRVCLVRFDAPVESRDAVLSVVNERAEALVDHLGTRGLVLTRMHVLIESDHGECSERMWYRSDGFGVRAITQSVRWQLEAWVSHAPPTSGVVALRLSPEEVVADVGRQATLWGGERDIDRHAHRAVRRVADVHGPQAVTVPTWRGGRDPARAFELVRSDAVDLERRSFNVAEWRGALPSPAPSLVFDAASLPDALQIDVVDRDGRRIAVDARHAMSAEPAGVRISGREYEVMAWAGPWPLEECWWDPRRARRAVRMQLVVRTPGSKPTVAPTVAPTAAPTTRAMVVVLEHRVWRLAAWYA